MRGIVNEKRLFHNFYFFLKKLGGAGQITKNAQLKVKENKEVQIRFAYIWNSGFYKEINVTMFILIVRLHGNYSC